MQDTAIDKVTTSVEMPSSNDLFKQLARAMRPTPPKLKSLGRNEVKTFTDDYKDYLLSHGDVELNSLIESGLLEFFKYSKNATTDAQILCELNEIVNPSSASAFEKEFSKVVFDNNETDGVQKLTKLFSDFEVALKKTNLAPPSCDVKKEYVLMEEEQCKMLMEKLPEDFKKHCTREKKYRVIDTKQKLYKLLCKLAKDWNWASKTSCVLENEANEMRSSTGTTMLSTSTLEDVRLAEQAKQNRRAKSRVNQILGRE